MDWANQVVYLVRQSLDIRSRIIEAATLKPLLQNFLKTRHSLEQPCDRQCYAVDDSQHD